LQANSLPVTSNQPHIHPRLPELLRRYLTTEYRKPVARHNHIAFEKMRSRIALDPRPIVLDSFCGTGHSTAILANRHPNHLVIGIDKSQHRLAKHPDNPDGGYLLLQAECEDIWQLMVGNGYTLDYHYLLYPNPWPKSGQLQRRIHGNPSIRYVLELGGRVELRSNWQIYVEEFGVALHLAGQYGRVVQLEPEAPVSLFERKYHASGHRLWVIRALINTANVTR